MCTSLRNTKVLYEFDPDAIQVDEANASISPLYNLSKLLKGTDASGPLHPLSDAADRFRFLLKHYPQKANISNSLFGVLYQGARAAAQEYYERLVLQAFPPRFQERLHELNHAARRGALYLLRSAIPRNEGDMFLWIRLREVCDMTLLKNIVSFL
jgi:hypothetical protein